MPYRAGYGDKPKVPWSDSKIFSVCQFTLFPLIRLVLILVAPIWLLLVILTWIPLMTVGALTCYMVFGDFRIIKEGANEGSDSPPYVISAIVPYDLYNSNVVRKFMGRAVKKVPSE